MDGKNYQEGSQMADEEDIVEMGRGSSGSGSGSGSSNSPFVIAVLVMNMFLMGAVAYLQYTMLEREKSRPSLEDLVKAQMQKMNPGEESEFLGDNIDADGKLFPLDPFTANLAQGDGPRRYIRLSVVLKFSTDSNEGEFKARKPQIRDTVINILNSKRPEDLLKREGKQFLKEEIKAAINSFLIDGKMVDVFYNSFQIN